MTKISLTIFLKKFLTIINFSGHFANVIKTGQEPKNSELELARLITGVDKKSAKSNIEILTEEQEGDCQEEEYYDDDFEGCRIFQTRIYFSNFSCMFLDPNNFFQFEF